MGTRWGRILAGLGSAGVAVALIAWALPAITGVPWSTITGQLSGLTATTLVWLAVLWLAGLWTYTFVLAGSLPGLRHAQAFVLNCAGSAISNVLPFGGAAGVALTFAMARSWGYGRRAIVVSTIVSGAWNMLSRLALPALGLAMLAATGRDVDRRLTVGATVAFLVVVLALGVIVAVVAMDGAPRWLAPVLRWPALAGLRRTGDVLRLTRQHTVEVIRRSWHQLTLGMVGYLALQFLLFQACLSATSAQVSLAVAVAAFALGRILASTSITPGGIGVTESGTAALLVALGTPGGPAAAAVLLFGVFTHLMEIPVGGLAWVTWLLARRWRVRPDAAPVEPDAVSTSEHPAPALPRPRSESSGPDGVLRRNLR